MILGFENSIFGGQSTAFSLTNHSNLSSLSPSLPPSKPPPTPSKGPPRSPPTSWAAPSRSTPRPPPPARRCPPAGPSSPRHSSRRRRLLLRRRVFQFLVFCAIPARVRQRGAAFSRFNQHGCTLSNIAQALAARTGSRSDGKGRCGRVGEFDGSG